jgi:hypothetical protein
VNTERSHTAAQSPELSCVLADTVSSLPIAMSQSSVTASAEWVALQDHYKQAKDWQMRDLFEQDTKRFEKFRSATLTPFLGGSHC